jgi:hypothetical protein
MKANDMKLVKWISILGLLAMSAVLIYGFGFGQFTQEGSRLLNMPWGIVSMVDLYTGFILFSGWIVYREKSFISSLVWVILMMVLGFWAGSLYTLLAIIASRGNWKKFWMGNRSEEV